MNKQHIKKVAIIAAIVVVITLIIVFRKQIAQFFVWLWGKIKEFVSWLGEAISNLWNNVISPWLSNVIAKVKEQIKKANPEMEYVSGYTGCSSTVMLRHNVCGQTFERSMNPIRHGMKTICPYCKATEQERKKQQHKADVQRRKKERQELAIVNKSKAIEKAAKRREERRHNCPVCGASTTRRKYCSDKCAKRSASRKYSAKNSATHEARRRVRIRTNIVDRDITLQQLYDKDNGVCWICGLLCDWSDIEDRGHVKVAGNMYPSIDHVVPLSHGGEHSWANVRLAHRICNSLRYEHAPRVHKKVG